METIVYQGTAVEVREIARPAGWSCRLLVSGGDEVYLEYLTSVGPYKIDVAAVHRLSGEEVAAYEAGRLDLGDLARRLADHA